MIALKAGDKVTTRCRRCGETTIHQIRGRSLGVAGAECGVCGRVKLVPIVIEGHREPAKQ